LRDREEAEAAENGTAQSAQRAELSRGRRVRKDTVSDEAFDEQAEKPPGAEGRDPQE
jgi:hypothetical protein